MGVLSGIRVLEFEAIGPGPFGGMLLADMGADVLRIDRPQPAADLGLRTEKPKVEVTGRGRRSVTLDLKAAGAADVVLELAARADVLMEGFRPGTMERLGLGPQAVHARNPRLVYGRMTGWGQSGPLAPRAGHDINYVALSGVLSTIGPAGGRPVPPLNLVGDYGGGGMLLALGVVAALLQVQRGGPGQVVDAAMFEGAAQLATGVWGLHASGNWREQRGSNLLDGGAPWFDTYRTRDGGYMAVGAAEARFYAQVLEGLGLHAAELPAQHDRERWPQLREKLAEAFAQRTRDEWCAVFDTSDACVTPVLSLSEAPQHPQALARDSFVEVGGVLQPAPAPRFSATPSPRPPPAPRRGQHGAEALRDWDFDEAQRQALRARGLGFLSDE